MASTIQVDKITDIGGNTMLESNGSGTITGLPASAISSGTIATANGGTGAANFAAAGLTNTPAFNAFLSSAASIANTTFTQIIFNQENFDTNSAYNTSTGFFTVPASLGGKYFIYTTTGLNNVTPQRCSTTVEKNSTNSILTTEFGNGSPYGRSTASGVVNLSAGDTLRVLIYQNGGGSSNTLTGEQSVCFGGYKIIE